MKYALYAKKVVTSIGTLENKYIIINDGIIEDVVSEVKGDMEVIPSEIVIPGLIDTHIHGCDGYDTMDGTYDALNGMSKYLARNGVTRFNATTVTAIFDRLIAAVKNVKDTMDNGTDGAMLMGSYIEGPYISPLHRGAHAEECLRKIDLGEIEKLVDAGSGTINEFIIAPELENGQEAVKLLTSKGIRVTIGHSDATVDVANEAIKNGAVAGVHIYNAMRGLHHREPGIVGAVLTNDNAYAEMIADTIHVHPDAMKIVVRCKGVDKVCLITDCMMAGGLKDGRYMLGELPVVVKDSICRIEDGALAGSTLKLINGVKNMVQCVGVSLKDAVTMASLNPAKLLGIDDVTGSIEKGKSADIAVIDENFDVLMTIVQGKIVWKK